MKNILLTKGYSALVDAQDYEWLTQWTWHAAVTRKGYVSAVRAEGNSRTPDTRRTITMAQAVCEHRGCPPSPLVDHEDGNSLNNQFYNLRPTDYKGNNRNARKRSGTSSFFKGVCWHFGKWQATLNLDKKGLYLGRFSDELEAAKAYDAAAKIHFGDFARLNLP